MNEHKQQTLSPDDPKLTAYALGEITDAERVEIETILKNDPAARTAVDDIRALAMQLEGALAEEALDETSAQTGAGTSDAGARAVEAGDLTAGPIEGGTTTTARTAGADPYRKKVIAFPYVWVGTLAAACVAVMIVLHDRSRTPLTGDHYAPAPGAAGSVGEIAESKATPSRAEGLAESHQLMAGKEKGGTGEARGQLASSPSVLLVKDADEFATIHAPEVPALKSALAASEAATAEAPAFAAAEPIKAEVTYADPGVPVAEPTPVLALARSEMRTEPSTPLDAASSLGESAADGLGETVHLSPFTVTADRSFGSSGGTLGQGRSAPLASGGRPVAQAGGSLYTRTDLIAPPLRMNFRAKSTTPARSGFNTEAYAFLADSEFFRVKSAPLSTFSADVDTASYANVRRFLDHGQKPPRDAVRVEEMVNYFNYRYAAPASGVTEPFAASMEIATAPWNPAHRLVRIGLKGREVATADRPAANLVFLLDVSGSMSDENKLPLVKESLRLLVEKLRGDDRVAIVTYAGSSGLALASTTAARKAEIFAALAELNPGGSTNGAMGIQLAYDIAKANFIEGGANRVILCTDGDFNVGTTSEGELTRLIEEKAKSGVYLTVLGFGMGNLKDSTLERLADKGNGNYGYIDSRAEAQKLLVEQAGSTLVTIAKDVKLQVEFNPAVAQAYRLIGYENRALKKEDFNNDNVDAGEIGAGHTVTALYEIVPVGAPAPTGAAGDVDALKYQPTAEPAQTGEGRALADAAGVGSPDSGKKHEELLTLKIRFKEPTVDVSRKMEIPVIDTGVAFEAASKDFKFAAAVASLGMILRESVNTGVADYDRVISWAEAGKGEDADGRRGEFIELVKKARALSAE